MPGDPSTAPRHHRVEQGIPPAPAHRRPDDPDRRHHQPATHHQRQLPEPVSTSPTGTVRSGRRDRSRTYAGAKPSFLQRNRNLLVGIAVIAIVGLAGHRHVRRRQPAGLRLLHDLAARCHADAGRGRIAPARLRAAGHGPDPHRQRHDRDLHLLPAGQRPPLQLDRYRARSRPRLYGPEDRVNPQGWIHNLEHGGLVVLYRGDSEGATEDGQAQLRAFFDALPAEPRLRLRGRFERRAGVRPLRRHGHAVRRPRVGPRAPARDARRGGHHGVRRDLR